MTVAEVPAVSNNTRYKLHISQITRRNEYSPLSNMKTLGYLDNVLAKIEAEKNGADDAILLNTKGHIACTSIGNLFLVQEDGSIITPPVEEGILPGITRQFVIEICKENKLLLVERALFLDDLFKARELFVTNSLIELVPVTHVNGQLVNEGLPAEITAMLQKYYQQRESD
jgi:branched-chain amino acid aminotransferase